MKSSRLVVLASVAFFALAATRSALAEVRASVVETKIPAFSADSKGRLRVAGYLLKDSEVDVRGRTKDGRYLKVYATRAKGGGAELYVRTRDVRLRRLSEAATVPVEAMPETEAIVPAHGVERVEQEDPYEPRHPWSFGAGMGGYSSRGKTSFGISGDLRYLWRTYTETLFGLDFAFGDTTAIGLRAGQRLYGTWSEKFRPYIHGGYRIADLSDGNTSAVELGGGFQVWYGGGSYFELGAFYLWNTIFDSNGENGILFGGSSGIRF